jgi:hypothetical protein
MRSYFGRQSRGGAFDLGNISHGTRHLFDRIEESKERTVLTYEGIG